MPRAPPSSELVSAMPEAAPARSGGALPTISAVDSVGTGASPSENATEPRAIPASPVSWERTISPALASTRPPAITRKGREHRPDREPGRRREHPVPGLQRRQTEDELQLLGEKDVDPEHHEDAEDIGGERRAQG